MRHQSAPARSIRRIGCCLTLAFAASGQAAEFTAHAEVVSAEPIIRYQTAAGRADSCITRPYPAQGLAALLEWDLAAGDCRRQDRRQFVDGFRVTYRWDGRLYERTLEENPGATLPVSIRVQ